VTAAGSAATRNLSAADISVDNDIDAHANRPKIAEKNNKQTADGHDVCICNDGLHGPRAAYANIR
jgi:hypothetical protein